MDGNRKVTLPNERNDSRKNDFETLNDIILKQSTIINVNLKNQQQEVKKKINSRPIINNSQSNNNKQLQMLSKKTPIQPFKFHNNVQKLNKKEIQQNKNMNSLSIKERNQIIQEKAIQNHLDKQIKQREIMNERIFQQTKLKQERQQIESDKINKQIDEIIIKIDYLSSYQLSEFMKPEDIANNYFEHEETTTTAIEQFWKLSFSLFFLSSTVEKYRGSKDHDDKSLNKNIKSNNLKKFNNIHYDYIIDSFLKLQHQYNSNLNLKDEFQLIVKNLFLRVKEFFTKQEYYKFQEDIMNLVNIYDFPSMTVEIKEFISNIAPDIILKSEIYSYIDDSDIFKKCDVVINSIVASRANAISYGWEKKVKDVEKNVADVLSTIHSNRPKDVPLIKTFGSMQSGLCSSSSDIDFAVQMSTNFSEDQIRLENYIIVYIKLVDTQIRTFETVIDSFNRLIKMIKISIGLCDSKDSENSSKISFLENLIIKYQILSQKFDKKKKIQNNEKIELFNLIKNNRIPNRNIKDNSKGLLYQIGALLKRRSSYFCNVNVVAHARVGVINFDSCINNSTFHCDLIVNRDLGFHNSSMIKEYWEMDKTLKIKKFMLFMKTFAKLWKIVDSPNGMLSSYCLTVMCLHVLLYYKFLPNIQSLKGINFSDGFDVSYVKLDNLPMVYESRLESTNVSQLIYLFSNYYTEKFNIVDDVVTLRGQGETISKHLWDTNKNQYSSDDFKEDQDILDEKIIFTKSINKVKSLKSNRFANYSKLSVEDPFEVVDSILPHDLASTIRNEIHQDKIFEAFRYLRDRLLELTESGVYDEENGQLLAEDFFKPPPVTVIKKNIFKNGKKENNNKKPNIDELKKVDNKDIILIDLEDDISIIEENQSKSAKRKNKRNRKSIRAEKEKHDKEIISISSGDNFTKLSKVPKTNKDFSISASNSNINLHDLTI